MVLLNIPAPCFADGKLCTGCLGFQPLYNDFSMISPQFTCAEMERRASSSSDRCLEKACATQGGSLGFHFSLVFKCFQGCSNHVTGILIGNQCNGTVQPYLSFSDPYFLGDGGGRNLVHPWVQGGQRVAGFQGADHICIERSNPQSSSFSS